MKNLAVVAALAAGSNARTLSTRTVGCCFELTAGGGASGPVGQLGDGQVRIGGGLPSVEFCIDKDGEIEDTSERPCFLTPPTSQLQCDKGATGTPGFSISFNGEFKFNGNTEFLACQTGDHGEFNIYTSPPPKDVTGCVEVTLEADKCKAPPSSSSSPPSSPSSPTSSPGALSPPAVTSVKVVTVTQTVCGASPTGAPPTIQPSCPTTLNEGGFEFPHLIVPVDSTQPDTPLGTQYNGQISSTVSTIYNFDIPPSDAGKTCSLVFLFPEKSQLQTSSFNFTGDGRVDFAQMNAPASQKTTFHTMPSIKKDFGVSTLAPGNSYVIATFPCPAGETIAFDMENSGSTDLTFFEDFNPSPIGLFITTC